MSSLKTCVAVTRPFWDIARRIAKAAEITDTAEYQLYRARALGLSTKEITQKIAQINGATESKIEKIIREAAEKSDEFDRKNSSAFCSEMRCVTCETLVISARRTATSIRSERPLS